MPDKITQFLGRLSAGALAVVNAAAIVTTAIIMLCLGPTLLTGVQRYTDLVVGEITFADAYKHGDVVAAFIAVALFFCIWCVLALLVAWRYAAMPLHEKTGEAGPLWLLSLFSCYFAGIVLMRTGDGIAELLISLLLLAAGLVVQRRQLDTLSERKIVFCVVAGVVTAGGLFFSALGIVAALKFFSPQGALGLVPEKLPLVMGGLGLVSVMYLWRLPERAQLKVAYAAQYLTPLLLLVGFCRVYQDAAGLTQNLVSPLTKGVAIALVGLFAGANIWQSRCMPNRETVELRDLLLRPAIMAVAAFLAFTIPAYLEKDFFHAGELFLTWHQVFEKGQFPFSGFAIARGFGDAVISLINVLFFDGNYATFTFAVPVYAMGISALNALLFCCLLGNGWGVILSVAAAAAPYCNVSLFLPVLLLLVQPKLLARPLSWLFAWVLLSVGLCLYHTTNGIAVTAGTLPVAVWICYGAIKNGHFSEAFQTGRVRLLGSAAALVLVLLVLMPLLVPWLTYVRDQGGVNELANGTLLLRELALPPWFRWQNRWAFEGVRIGGWLLGCFLLWHLFMKERIRRVKMGDRGLPQAVEALALAGIASTVAFIPYSMGRIDGKGLSRTGSVAMLVLCIMVPLVVVLARKGRPGFASCCAVFLIGIGAAAYYESPLKMAHKAMSAVKLPADVSMINGPAVGLHKVGNAFVDDETVSKIMRLKATTDRYIRPGETYLDLTNHVGYYYLLDYTVPSLYAGYYIVTSETLQNKVIATLVKNPPPMVLAAPARTFGSGTAALRSYRLYKWLLLQGYVPVDAGGLAVLVRPDRYRHVHAALPPVDEQLRLLSAIFAEEYVAGIPLAWGRNLDLLRPRFRQGGVAFTQTSQAHGTVQSGTRLAQVTTVEMSASQPVRGDEYDFLELKPIVAGGAMQIRIRWREANGEYKPQSMIVFEAEPGTPLLVPLGSNPAWLLTRDIRDLKFEIVGGPGAGGFPFKLTLLSLIK